MPKKKKQIISIVEVKKRASQRLKEADKFTAAMRSHVSSANKML